MKKKELKIKILDMCDDLNRIKDRLYLLSACSSTIAEDSLPEQYIGSSMLSLADDVNRIVQENTII